LETDEGLVADEVPVVQGHPAGHHHRVEAEQGEQDEERRDVRVRRNAHVQSRQTATGAAPLGLGTSGAGAVRLHGTSVLKPNHQKAPCVLASLIAVSQAFSLVPWPASYGCS